MSSKLNIPPIVLALALMASVVAASPGPPVPVSPAAEIGAAVVEHTCPTFSWGQVDGAAGYELVVYELTDGAAMSDEPALRAALPAGTAAWTPAEDCLAPGGRYAWLVRARDTDGSADWSEATLFTVTEAPSVDDVRHALRVLRRYTELAKSDRENEDPHRDLDARTRASLEDFREHELRPSLQTIRQSLHRQAREVSKRTGAARSPSDGEVASAAAPTLGDASLTISEQLHLADTSAVFKNDQVFLWDDTSGNLGLGRQALASASSTATGNIAMGRGALQSTTSGSSSYHGSTNIAIGYNALGSNTTGSSNLAIGAAALDAAMTSRDNVAVGNGALGSDISGNFNVSVGNTSLRNNTTGKGNVAVGYFSAYGVYSGDHNLSIGYNAGPGYPATFEGDRNVMVGRAAGYYAPSTASDNIFIGSEGTGDESTPTIRIGTEGTQTRAFLAGVDGATVTGSDVLITTDGQLGVASSSRRFKEAIQPLDGLNDALLALEPVLFRYRAELVPGGGDVRVGLIAEDVAAVFPALVTRDEEGQPFAVRYDLLSVLLLEELQGQHAKLVAVERRLDELAAREPAAARDRPPWWKRLFRRQE